MEKEVTGLLAKCCQGNKKHKSAKHQHFGLFTPLAYNTRYQNNLTIFPPKHKTVIGTVNVCYYSETVLQLETQYKGEI